MDQLKSSAPGLIGQIKGWLTNERQYIATVFVDHYSDLTYVHTTPSDTSIETVEAKEAFERFAASHHVTVKHYHADNGRFAATLFKEHVAEKGQSIKLLWSWCASSKWQGGRRESETLLISQGQCFLHAAHRWPKAVSAALWPYALLHSVNIRNNMSTTCQRERHHCLCSQDQQSKTMSFGNINTPLDAQLLCWKLPSKVQLEANLNGLKGQGLEFFLDI